jgi:hypothetical protein
MSSVVSIPHDLLFLVANYLLPKNRQNKMTFRYSHDWRNFINTSKEYFSEWKKQTQVIVLESEYAVTFIRSLQFFHRIKQEIVDSLHQLDLCVVGTHFQEQELRPIDRVKSFSANRCTLPRIPQLVSHLSLNQCIIHQLSPNSGINGLCLHYCQIGSNAQHNTVDVSTLTITEGASFKGLELQNYQSLSSLSKSVSIERCKSITDVSCFRNLQKVEFDSCPNITDVSCLCDVHELSLIFCGGITDVSSLGRVYNLELLVCRNISDVSALGNVHTLGLYKCSDITDVSALNNVYELRLELFTGNSLIGLENVVKLFLTASLFQNQRYFHVEGSERIIYFFLSSNYPFLWFE